MSKTPDTYTVNLIFRGLVLARPTSAGLAILLPDGTSPKNIPRPEGAAPITTNEHFGVLEFFQGDWQNPTALLPETIQATKPAKKPVAISFLGPRKSPQTFCDLIRFETLRGSSMRLPEIGETHRYNTTFPGLPDTLKILDRGCEHGFLELAPFAGEPDHLAWQTAVGCSLITTGEVRSERRSKDLSGVKDLEWVFPSLSQVFQVLGGELTLKARPINLDLRVRFEVSRHDALVISLVSKDRSVAEQHSDNLRYLPSAGGSSGSRVFVLKPSDPDADLTVWVKNRELKRILLDSDLLPDPFFLCGDLLPADFDHYLFGQFLADPTVVPIPVPSSPGQSDCGAGCGCKG